MPNAIPALPAVTQFLLYTSPLGPHFGDEHF
jgi:hypothetical protein